MLHWIDIITVIIKFHVTSFVFESEKHSIEFKMFTIYHSIKKKNIIKTIKYITIVSMFLSITKFTDFVTIYIVSIIVRIFISNLFYFQVI